jgi:hypothetical protein
VCIAIPPTKISDFLPKIKDDLGLRTPGIYSIPCECGKVYIGQTGRTTDIELKNTNAIHISCKQNNLPWRNVAYNRITKSGFRIQKFYQTSGYMERLIMEAIQVEIHPNNLNREDGLRLSTIWEPILKLIKR